MAADPVGVLRQGRWDSNQDGLVVRPLEKALPFVALAHLGKFGMEVRQTAMRLFVSHWHVACRKFSKMQMTFWLSMPNTY